MNNNYPKIFNNEIELEEALSRPNAELVAMMKNIEGSFIFLGVAGKMGVSMAIMAKRACKKAGVDKKIIGVSRFSSEKQRLYLEEQGIETIKGDLTEQEFINSLPLVENVVYLAGMKFGTEGNESVTWAMNSYLPGLVADRFKNSKILAFSTGCVYPLVEIKSGGSKEIDRPNPVGEYAQSCLGRERLFEYGSIKNKTKVILIRLNYSVEMRYGVLVDVATKVYNNIPVDVKMGYANVIWQGDANNMILQSIELAESPAKCLNISGPEIISIREVAKEFGKLMNKKVSFMETETETALLVNVKEAQKLFGKPKVNVKRVIKWTANWLMNDGETLGKPTHFEVRDGKY